MGRDRRDEEYYSSSEDDEDDEDEDGLLEAAKRHRERLERKAEAEEQRRRNFIRMLEVAETIVDLGHKQAAKKAHPDVGGSHEEMQDINAAEQWLIDVISRNIEEAAATL